MISLPTAKTVADGVSQEGGCLCGQVRYQVARPPMRVSFCHCRFCQRVTGTAYAVEPIFDEEAFALLQGEPKTYSHVSEGSGKRIDIHFCPNCGTSYRYTFERFAGVTGIMAGTFDDPNWFSWTPATAKHIFLSEARPETIIPDGLPAFLHHAMTNEGEALEPLTINGPTEVRDIR